MIHSLKIENFYSFQEEVLISFTAGKKAGAREVFLPSALPDTHVNSVTGVFGGNASGKTTLLKAISFLRHFLTSSSSDQPDEKIPVCPFRFQEDSQNKDTRMELIFEYEETLFRYELEVTQERVISEKLHRKDKRFRYLFEREWHDESGSYVLKSQDIGPTKHIALRENASFLSMAVLQENAFAKGLCRYFNLLYTNIGAEGRNTSNDPEVGNIMSAAEFYSEQPEFLKDLEVEMVNADLGISKISIDTAKFLSKEGEEEVPFPLVSHKVADREYTLPLFSESRGTQAYFILLRYILPVLKVGGVAVIDEFETGLHSHMVRSIVELFYSKRTNPHGAQLIASFHSDYLLIDTLEKYQIVLCEKDPETLCSDAWRLDELEGVKNSANHYAKYHAGAYGGIPNL